MDQVPIEQKVKHLESKLDQTLRRIEVLQKRLSIVENAQAEARYKESLKNESQTD